MLDSLKPNLFSGMQGKVIRGGKPISGAKVDLEVRYWNVGVWTRSAISDENGEFSLPSIRAFALRAYVPFIHPIIDQKIYVEYDDIRKSCWRHSKGIPWGNTETGNYDGKAKEPIKVLFDLDETENKVQDVGVLVIGGACTLLNPDPQRKVEVRYVE